MVTTLQKGLKRIRESLTRFGIEKYAYEMHEVEVELHIPPQVEQSIKTKVVIVVDIAHEIEKDILLKQAFSYVKKHNVEANGYEVVGYKYKGFVTLEKVKTKTPELVISTNKIIEPKYEKIDYEEESSVNNNSIEVENIETTNHNIDIQNGDESETENKNKTEDGEIRNKEQIKLKVSDVKGKIYKSTSNFKEKAKNKVENKRKKIL